MARFVRRHLNPDEIDRILRKYAKRIALDRGYSAHSMRATFITTALDNGASLEDVQRAAGHADSFPAAVMTGVKMGFYRSTDIRFRSKLYRCQLSNRCGRNWHCREQC